MWIAAPVSLHGNTEEASQFRFLVTRMALTESGTRIAKWYCLKKHLEVFARYGEGTDGARSGKSRTRIGSVTPRTTDRSKTPFVPPRLSFPVVAIGAYGGGLAAYTALS